MEYTKEKSLKDYIEVLLVIIDSIMAYLKLNPFSKEEQSFAL